MSEATAPAVSMPGFSGTVIETSLQPKAQPAQSGPAYVSDTAGMSPSQAAAMRFVDSTRAAFARDMNNLQLQRQHREALAHVFHGGPQPGFITVDPNAAPATEGGAPAKVDPESVDGFARVAEVMAPEEIAHYRTAGVNLGLHPEVSGVLSTLAADFGVPRAVANDLQSVAVAHFGASHDVPALDSIPVLDDAGLADMQAAAVAKYGEDVISDLSAKARQVLADKGLLQKFDDLGLTRSSLAFDRRALRSIIFWGKLPQGKK